ncbi:hypothetical protein ACFE04_017506 [Oxalis oulophora]
MAPRNNRGKGKGDKKKKEEKVLPVVMDITVNLPDETQVILKGISTDRIIDIRRLLAVNTETCHVTNFSLSHDIRGPQLKDTVDVSALKPCILALIEEDYDENSASAHVRRVLDIVACTSSFGPSALATGKNAAEKTTTAANVKKSTAATGDKSQTITDDPGKRSQLTKSSSSKDEEGDDEAEMSHTCPKLGSFYEFFSLSHLTPPLQFIRRTTKRHVDEVSEDDHLYSLEVKLCNGKLVHVEACRKGFYSVGKQRILCHNIVDLLRQLSKAFDNAYDELMKAFSERNKFGNLPYGFRANTWLVPPIAAQLPSNFPSLPVEDEQWGGNGGGLGRNGTKDLIPWANEFSFLASMPCKTPEERQVRDRKAFLLHSLFVDVAIFRAIKVIHLVMGNTDVNCSLENCENPYTERVGDLNITVLRDASNASCKVDMKVDGIQATRVNQKDLVERNLLKGITADENTAAHDIATLGVVNVRYCGYVAIVKVDVTENQKVGSPSQSLELLEQPEGGANALNINSLRLLLHKTTLPEHNKSTPLLQTSKELEVLSASQAFVEKLVEESLAKLEKEEVEHDQFLRWELGACWIQHLQDQKNADKDKKLSSEKTKSKNEMKVEGLGTPLKSLKNKKSGESNLKKRSEENSNEDDATGQTGNDTPISAESKPNTSAQDNELVLKKMLSESSFARLRDSETGLHCKSLSELIDLSQKYYSEVALPKLVADFGSLELSPVDGRTLTDFMHTRGLRMRSLGQVVKLSEKLSHVQSLCIHEMIIRAYKHILQAVIAAVRDPTKMAATIAAALNLMLGVPANEESNKSCNIHSLSWKWLEVFVNKRYEWDLSSLSYKDIRKFAILRGLCHKVGIELVPRDFDMNSPTPFQESDIVSLVPVHKATIYQQKALDINERELGLDHPDTMKSYGDLAVFYYRLQHTELALKYVKRALYLLHLTCGPSHPNTAATYINVAMMEEGLGNVHIALRYLHKALKCNQKLLGPDHIQTAASYHAIAIALSLMEAYPLSVQHEQTTLQILRAKLGPDDLRTQDAAAWLEYFESKAFEQQEAARNGTRKPDASIASKGHLSVSDLLDYINPSPDAKGRNGVTSKRRSYIAKMKKNSYQNISSTNSDDSPLESPKESPEELPKESSVDETHISEPVGLTEITKDNIPALVQSQESITEEPIEQKLSVPVDNTLSEIHIEGDEGWQPVQRPRSAGSYGRRLKQRRAAIGKVYVYQKKDIENLEVKNAHQNSRYYLLKRRMTSHGNYIDHHPASPVQVTKYGRKIVRGVTYRVKSVVSSSTKSTTETSGDNKDNLVSLSQSGDNVVSSTQSSDVNPMKTSIVCLGKSPSYKEVAVAPPGTISKLQIWVPQTENSNNQEFGISKHDYESSQGKERAEPVLIGSTENEEKDKNLILHTGDYVEKEIRVAEKQEEIPPVENQPLVVSNSVKNPNDDVQAHEVIKDCVLINNISDPIDCPKGEILEKESIIFEDELKDQTTILSSADVRNSKLSASAAPFNPAPALPRSPPVNMNLPLPSGPPIAPWPVNMTLHPGPLSPRPLYPSPPPTPTIMTPLPFMYNPSYSQPQPVPTSTFPMTSSAFHPSQFSWQCNMNPNISDFIPRTIWRPMEYSIPPPIVEPIADPIPEPYVEFNDPAILRSSPMQPADISNLQESKKEISLPESEVLNNAHANLQKNHHLGESAVNNNSRENSGLGSENALDSEKTFSILVRGRRNRKQTLRMPIRLLTRPYGSQFKVVYNRVIRGSESPKSSASFSSPENHAALFFGRCRFQRLFKYSGGGGKMMYFLGQACRFLKGSIHGDF